MDFSLLGDWAAFQLEHVRERWRENFNATLDLAREDSETFLRRLFAVSESCYLLNDLFLFGFGAIEKGRFSAFEYRFGRGSRNWVPTYRNQGLYVGSRGGSGCPPIPIT